MTRRVGAYQAHFMSPLVERDKFPVLVGGAAIREGGAFIGRRRNLFLVRHIFIDVSGGQFFKCIDLRSNLREILRAPARLRGVEESEGKISSGNSRSEFL